MSVATTAEDRDMGRKVNWNERLRRLLTFRKVVHVNDTSTESVRTVRSTPKRLNAALWIVQGLLAALFVFAGSTKLLLPIEVLISMGSPNQIVLPGWFLRFIGTAEVFGAIGLILPQLLRIRPQLTPLAATGLVIIMIGATSLTMAADGFAPALFPMVIGFLASFVAYRRWTERLN